MNTRRQAFVLAGALTATVLTAAAALAGIAHGPATQQPGATPVVQVAPQSPLQPTRLEDD